MPKFLNNLNLNGNQLLNTKLEVTDSPTQAKGIIHYHDTSDSVRVYTGTGSSDFFTLGDNDVATSSAAGTVELFSDTAQTVAANSVSTTSSRTYGIQLNGDGQMVVNVPWSDTTIANTNTQNTTTLSFVDSTDDILIRNTTGGAGSGTDDIKIVAGTNITLTHTDADNFTISSTDTNTQLNNSGVIGKVLTGLDTSSGSAVAAADTIVAAFGKLENRVAANDLKVTNSTIAARVAGTGLSLSTNTFNVNVDGTNSVTPTASSSTASRTYKVQTDSADNLVVNVPWSDTTIANTDVNVSVANLKTALAGGFALNAVAIGDSDDVVTIGNKLVVTGDLQVDGTTTTLNTATLDVEDLNITIAKGAADAAAANGAGITIDGAAATMLYRNVTDDFIFNKGIVASSFSGTIALSNLDIDGGTALGAAPDSTDLMIVDDGAGGTNKSMTVANLQSYMQNALTFIANTDTIDMGDGFTVSADTNTAATTITEGDTLTISGGTGITTVSNPDGTITITNDVVNTNTNQLTTFTLRGTTNTTPTTVNHGDTITIAAGTGITTTSTSDGTVTVVNSAPNIVQTAITGNAGSATVLEAGAVGGVKVFELTHGVGGVVNENTSNSTDSSEWTITHAMGNGRFYKVEVVQDSGNYDTVYVDVTRPLDTTVKVTFGADVANGAYRAMLTRMA